MCSYIYTVQSSEHHIANILTLFNFMQLTVEQMQNVSIWLDHNVQLLLWPWMVTYILYGSRLTLLGAYY